MTRKVGIYLVLVMLVILLGWDISQTPPDPYSAPDPLVWGSSEGASGALCALPGQ